ncbi:MAG: hypothetical protein ABJC26_04595 [Gemmatimonadaceae bacterium]
MRRHSKPSGILNTVVTLPAVLVLALAVACGGGDVSGSKPNDVPPTVFSPTLPNGARVPSCGTSLALMTVSPITQANMTGWVPLGNLGPPGHLFPTDHQYLYVNRPASGNAASTFNTVPVVAPANIIITGAHRTHYSASNLDDYTLDFALCDEVRGTFGHIAALTPDLLQELGAFDQQCYSYDLGLNNGSTFSGCYAKPAGILRSVGVQVASAGGQTSIALDFWLHDTRRAPLAYANAVRWNASNPQAYTVAASDYFSEPARSEIRARLGNYNGTMLRTVEPLGGEIAYDVAATLRGLWVNAAQISVPEAAHLAFVPDNVDPAILSVSMGTSQPDFAAGLYQYTPMSNGYVNRDPAQITSDGHIYCFETGQGRGVILAQMETATSVKVEGRSGYLTCADQSPFAFTSKTFVYVR